MPANRMAIMANPVSPLAVRKSCIVIVCGVIVVCPLSV